VAGPLIPFIHLPELPIPFLSFINESDPPTIKPFGTLVALGVYIGSIVAVRRAKERGLNLTKMNSFIFWVVGLGFVGGHVLDAIFYTPDRVAADPLYLLKLWAGLSSFGGFIGAVTGALLYKVVKKDDVLPYVDVVCSAFPLAWVFGRAGCATVHDHPGKVSDFFLAVVPPVEDAVRRTAPAAPWRNLEAGMGRFDLGLIEMLLTIPLAVTFHLLWRRGPRHFGFYSGWMCVLYAPVRFLLDFLRLDGASGHEGDPRYGGLTPAQWGCFGLVALGFYVIHLGKKLHGNAPATYEESRMQLARERGEDELDSDDQESKPVEAVSKVKKKKLKSAGAKTAKAATKKPVQEDEVGASKPHESADADGKRSRDSDA
jgi:phosphatidylglycerol---prolipoprotein diacylglyceryl transferase